MITTEEHEALRQTFTSLDKNQDGMLEKDELLNGFIELYDETYAREECDRIFELVDVD